MTYEKPHSEKLFLQIKIWHLPNK